MIVRCMSLLALFCYFALYTSNELRTPCLAFLPVRIRCL
jgi:hypothetical protein